MTSQPDLAENIIEAPFAEALSERYLSYALSTIMARSLPDVRDGMKPVHRRLLYAMRLLKLDPKTGFKKCARVVGDVIGKYHPHGDAAVYDALVRLAQDFSVRYPLIDGQGNFGNIDGDNAAAMRYTEARLTDVAVRLMDGLDEDAVDFRATYDGEEREPVVFPGAVPNLLANGASGIAVGMATSIPPHNVAELLDALALLIAARRDPARHVTIDDLMGCIQGPDFPTGGEIVEDRAAIREAYETGRGGFRVRARWHREDMGRGLYQVVVTEIPYQVQKSRLIEKIADLVSDRKLPILADIRDESTDELRIVLEPKNRTVPVETLMESLFKLTDLEQRFPLNMNVIALDQSPRVLPLKDVLESFLDHQLDVLLRRNRFRLDKIEKRLEILSGYLVAYLNLDEVIRIIREEDHAKTALMAAFDLSDTQAEAILNMRLRALRKLEEVEIRKEHDALSAERADIKTLLASQDRQWAAVDERLAAVREAFHPESTLGRRRSTFGEAPDNEAVPLEALVEKEPVTVVCSRRGWIRALKGHLKPEEEVKYKEGDAERFRFTAHTTDKVLAMSNRGKIYTLAADKLPGGRGHGEPVRLLVDMESDEEIIALLPYVPGSRLLVAASNGKGFLLQSDNAVAMKKAGKQILNLKAGAHATHCIPADGDSVAVIGTNRKLLVFDMAELSEMTRGQGVALQRYKDAELSDVIVFNRENGLSWPMKGKSERWRTETDLMPWTGKRGNAGRLPPVGFPRTNRFSG
ncbi:DNA topoisomerase IV subunit A [Yunchengibacter salinarum]|uniref:DNA topoisomerase IV subunit A n=1 Tax=Yunchengibacter salinarum TaxID=3133399 RepID=UPI0035B693B2